MTATSWFILTALNAWEWAALAGSSAVITAAAVWTHRRDMQRHRAKRRP